MTTDRTPPARHRSPSSDLPIRDEIVGAEHLEQLAEALGVEHGKARVRRGRSLLAALRRNRDALREARNALDQTLREQQTITVAAEWLVDNYHVVEEQVRQSQQDLSPGFYRELPKLDAAPWEGLPRVYALAWKFVAATDSRFNPELLARFVHGYQRATPLRIGELWTLPIHLRLVLVENLRRLASGVLERHRARSEANSLADAVLGLAPAPPPPPVPLSGLDLGAESPAVAFVVQLLQRLREQDPEATPLLAEVRAALEAHGLTEDEVTRLDHQRQAASQVSVSNVIYSMRQISAFDWPSFVEQVSTIDQVLRRDPAGLYAAQDFDTRDLYRHAVEELARGSRLAELEVAERAVARARAAAAGDGREGHVGYWLAGPGCRELERELRFRPELRQRWVRAVRGAGLPGYLGLTTLLTAGLLALLAGFAAAAGAGGLAVAVLLVLALIPASDVALAAVNRLVSELVPARPLPKLALEQGVPAALRTLVAVPVLLRHTGDVESLVERLEVHYLANPEGEVSFALLSDFADGPAEHAPEDEALLRAAIEAVARLNERYGPGSEGGAPRFLLLHRRRQWNPAQGCWMGWERKRGKLTELNRLLRGATDTSFLPAEGGLPPVPSGVRYVITLDADTQLPPGAVTQLVGAIAHPLHRARLDPRTRRVTEGYGILQPRVASTLPAFGEGTPYQRIFSGPVGVDPYVAAVSDVYQDLFGEGSFTGKGIYDVDAFEAALAGRVPDNALLSHDLFEGSFARAGLASDVVLFEGFPAHFLVSASRQSRWVRGDWQLLPWLLPRVPTAAGGERARNPLPALARWKMIDNLRRSLSPPASLLLAVAGWLLLPGRGWAWDALLVLGLGLPALIPALVGLLPRRRGIAKRTHLGALLGDLGVALSQALLVSALLASRAVLRADAILRTLGRLWRGRRLLEWVTAAQAEAGARLELASFYRGMKLTPVLAVAVAVLVAVLAPAALPAALPFVLVWLAAPWAAYRLSLPTATPASQPLSTSEAGRMRLLARRAWSYFERFATAEENHLPPDNFQEDPRPVIANRTSPTNVGLGLLATVTARDLGWAGRLETLERLEATFATLGRMERFRGHFLNWYDTRTLQVLPPRYVSTVDSGNLAGHLIALAAGCRELAEAPPLPAADLWRGVGDALALVEEELAAASIGSSGNRELRGILLGLAAALADPSTGLPDLRHRAADLEDLLRALAAEDPANGPLAEALYWAEACRRTVESHARDLAGAAEDTAAELAGRWLALAERAEALVREMEFGFLLHPVRKLLVIGYRLEDQQQDENCYDFLASEARLASYLAVAKSEAPYTHWFRLGRPLTPLGRGSALLSWSGSMFEYLMPSLVLLEPPGSLLGQSCRWAVAEQIRYGGERGVPWGISESAYNARDLQLNYQYGPQGVPRLSLRRDPPGELVIAPYATALAAMVEPQPAMENFARLAALGASGRHGFYEALDFTPGRVPDGERFALIRSFMSHHQGMSLLAFANVLLPGELRRRFHSHPLARAAELLLQERTQRDVVVTRPLPEERARVRVQDGAVSGLRSFDTPHLSLPMIHLLSNGVYSVMLTTSGSGWSRYRGRAVTRFREDATRDDWGTFLYLRDVASGRLWSAGYQPAAVEPDAYHVLFSAEKVEIRRTDGPVVSHLEVVLSPEDDAELRRLTLTNQGSETRQIEVTSYAELALAAQAADEAHPAFNKLFLHTEVLRWPAALLATRRNAARGGEGGEEPFWAAHVLAVEGETVGPPQYETDRARFLGRGLDVRRPRAIAEGRPLSGTVGAVLDPIFSLRQVVSVPPGGRVRLVFGTLVAPSREAAVARAERYAEPPAFQRAARLAWILAHVEQRHFGLQPDEAHVFLRLASHLVFANPRLRSSLALERNRLGVRDLWGFGISGDLPILLLRIDQDGREITRQLVQAHELWRSKGLPVDLVILNEQPGSYVQDQQAALEAVVRSAQVQLPAAVSAGGVFVLRADQMSFEQRDLLRAAARVVLLARHGSLADQVARHLPGRTPPPRLPAAPREPAVATGAAAVEPRPDLLFFNGLGGFADGGREYQVLLRENRHTPLPWVNVVANPQFGFLVSESGAGFTWALNSRENRLTPWSNDPIGDPPGEALYLRDEETGALWSPTASPIRNEASSYLCRHGQGWSAFEHGERGIGSELLLFVPADDPVRIARLTLVNRSPRPRRLSVTAYVEWVLGNARPLSAPFVVTSRDEASGAILASNSWNPEFAERVSFAWLSGKEVSATADRAELLGRNGTLAAPAALVRGEPLSGRVGVGLDPCAALQTRVELAPGGRAEVIFLLGQGEDREAALDVLSRYRTADAGELWEDARQRWDDVLGAFAVRTPDPAFDLMVNRWLLYQTLACRIWGRSGLYQSSGAWGFRDQLQDSMALAAADRGVARGQLLRAAARQFVEGDVQHWWHEPSGRGIRTRCSDDLLWLPYAAAHYLEVTGDAAVLDETVPFLQQPPVPEGHAEDYRVPEVAAETGPLYEHCARAIERALAVGEGRHGLPLIGSCDWNDGFNRVGQEGKGESVWMGWFLIAVIDAFAPTAEARGDARAAAWRRHAAALRESVQREAWDGRWYLRAFYDDGQPLGSAADPECQIDSLAQTWAVISGAGDPQRAALAMKAVDERLVDREAGLVRLFTPPFDRSPRDPGYIKEYPPGVRENGGQYTHAAAWTVVAFAELGDGDRAAELFGLINPIRHGSTRAEVMKFKVEPYVLAGDVYGAPPHVGRGGWTWYTGSAGWMYRAAVEWILGFRLRGRTLRLDPCLPRAWPEIEMSFRYHSARYVIRVENPAGVSRGVVRTELDGAQLPEPAVPLADDGLVHRVRLLLGEP